jgi:transcription-repair coupling factor (superfamily II helicase)
MTGNLAWLASRLAEELTSGDVTFLCDDDQQAESLPSSDALPGDRVPASPANIGRRVAGMRRLRLLNAASRRPSLACIFSGEAAARLYPPPASYDLAPPFLRVGDAIDMERLDVDLLDIGYIVDDRVDEPGELAVRGDVIDIYPVDADLPARIEVADGRISSIRTYDAISQRSVDVLEQLEIGRAAEPDLGKAVTLLDHLPQARIGFSQYADKPRLRFIALAADAASRATGVLDAVSDAEWGQALTSHPLIDMTGNYEAIDRFSETSAPLRNLGKFARVARDSGRPLIIAGSARDLRFLGPRIAKLLKVDLLRIESWSEALALSPSTVALLVAPVPQGFVSESIIFVAAADVLGSRALLQDYAATINPLINTGIDIKTGDVVVHEDHGVGLVAGLEPAPGAEDEDMIALEYARGARRLVPVNAADRIWRYGADADAVTLDKLDGSSWAKRRADIDAAIRKSAEGLARMADARAKLTATVIEPDTGAYESFAGGFAFTETADQARAISAVRDDLASRRPMDRLVIGDVGYGKTEVALRAAALTVLAGYQVIVAVPTIGAPAS